MSPKEQWVEFDTLPSYSVSNYGIVANIRRHTLLTPCPDSTGHLRVALYKDNKRHDIYLNRLVAKAFLDDYQEGIEVWHIDGDITNCVAWNLKMGDKACKIGEKLW